MGLLERLVLPGDRIAGPICSRADREAEEWAGTAGAAVAFVSQPKFPKIHGP